MNYFISFTNAEEFDWCVLVTDDYDYAYKVFEDLCPLPGYKMELRATDQDIDTYTNYEVLRYDYSNY